VTTQPREGVCAKCSQRRPLFELDLNVWPWDENGTTYVCVRCYDDARHIIDNQSQEDMGIWLPIRPDDWDQFALPNTHAQLDRAIAAGPIGKIRSFGPDGEAQP
jgi:DNA-directed RNA polymerase subunit RPC12/RpoP